MPTFARIAITGTYPLSYGKAYVADKHDHENDHDFEKRTWRERGHYDAKGNLIIPAICFQKALQKAGKRMNRKIPGQRNATFTKHFESGIMVIDGITLSYTRETVPGEWLFVPSDGVAGSGKRVHKCFPTVPPGWGGTIRVAVLDPVITRPIFEEAVATAAIYIGLLRWRPERGGLNGRFDARVEWEDGEAAGVGGEAKAKRRA